MSDINSASSATDGQGLLVAVATKGDNQINLHFGHADDFAVYEVSGAAVRFVDTRKVEHYCQGGYGDEDKREVILRALADCKALFVAKVGDGPAQRLRDADIAPIGDYAYGAIDASLMDWYRKQAAA